MNPPPEFPDYIQRMSNAMAWYIANQSADTGDVEAYARRRFEGVSDADILRALQLAWRAIGAAERAENLPGDAELIDALAGTRPPYEEVQVNALVPIETTNQKQQYKQVTIQVPWHTTMDDLRFAIEQAVDEQIATYEQVVGAAVISGPLLFPSGRTN
jgi:hypothetical protein